MRLEVAKDERGLFVESDNTVLQISKSIDTRRRKKNEQPA